MRPNKIALNVGIVVVLFASLPSKLCKKLAFEFTPPKPWQQSVCTCIYLFVVFPSSEVNVPGSFYRNNLNLKVLGSFFGSAEGVGRGLAQNGPTWSKTLQK